MCTKVKQYRKPIHSEITSETKVKICSRCKSRKSCEDFYKNKSNRDGYESQCKNCSSYRKSCGKINIRLEKPKPKGVEEGSKWCPTCEVIKTKDNFCNASKRKDGLQPICKPCGNKSKRESNLRKKINI